MGQMRRMGYRPGVIGGPGDDGQGGGTNARTLPSGLTVQAPYRVPGAPGAQGRALRGWLDPKGIMFWRLVFVGLAVAYVCGFHVTIGRLRVRV